MNSDFDPLPIGRIVSMWEQAKKKRLTIEWFYRGNDILRATQDKSDDKEEGEDRKVKPFSIFNSHVQRRKVSDLPPQAVSTSSGRYLLFIFSCNSQACCHPNDEH